MAPTPKGSKPAKAIKQSGSLHMFFGPNGSQPKTIAKNTASSQPSASGSQKVLQPTSRKAPDATIVDDSDDEPLVPSKVPTSVRAKTVTRNATIVSSDDETSKPSKSTPAKVASPKRKKLTIVESSDEEAKPTPKKESTLKRKKSKVVNSSDDDEEATPPKKKAAVSSSKSSKPRASTSKAKPTKAKKDEDYDMELASEEDDDDDNFIVDDDEDEKPKKKKRPTPKKAPAAKSAKASSSKEKIEDTKAEVKEPPKPKPNWVALKAARAAGPVAHGSKEIPDGAPDALAGLSFVFTGELSSFSRDEAIELGKRFGGRVVGQPSSKTDFVVLGDNAGPSKLAAIKKHGIKTLTEDEFLNLIATRKGLGNGKVDEKTKKKMEKEQEDIKKAAKEMEKREKKEVAEHVGKVYDPSTQLWTTRYAPQSLKEICGNKGQVEKLLLWLQEWSNSLKAGFKKPGKNAMNVFRAVLITGSPGIGKTTSAHLCARLAGYTPIEMNASDSRSKKLVENGMNINNTNLDGFLHGGPHQTSTDGVMLTDKSCLIMDEVDGMSAGDRGGVGALNAMIKKTKIPIICIANDRGAQKLKPLMATTFSLPFHKPQVQAVRSRILSIAFKEKLKIPGNVVDQLINGSQSDIRQVLNMLSTWKLSHDAMDFDESKDLSKANQKHAIMTPFDITSKMLGPYLYSPTSRESLGDKMEYYFQDHSFVPLFIQENYLKTIPARSRNFDGPEKILKDLRLMDQAASSISDGDLVDTMIRGPEQHWALMPLHAICSTVKPTSCMYGNGAGYGGPNAMSFPQWLGQNSKQIKLNRQLGDIQIRMRLKVSGDKHEIRQAYIPALFPHIVMPLQEEGASAVSEVIERMDDYFLSKEDWDTIVELGVGERKDDLVLKKISAATKTALTRKYNSAEHPIPFHKAEDLGKLAKKLPGGPAPDLEEAYVDDIADDNGSDDEAKSKDSDDVTKDSLIKVAKKRKAPAAKASKK
ncbi:DNA replication factor C, large subunit [Pholiota conissans]|uniref:Replication factor C subunit 1 n=1 Tax=Pholiota conissans TaxID=109636 RepID=A0A9P6CQH2_9AGAR|nr:DNA replication factor C, large subunit [Pholiota conissans]